MRNIVKGSYHEVRNDNSFHQLSMLKNSKEILKKLNRNSKDIVKKL